MGYITFYGMTKGNLKKLLAPVNGDGILCGTSSDFNNYKYLYLTDFSISNVKNIFNSGICVEKCPEESTDTLNCLNTEHVSKCETDVHVYKSFTLVNYCIPDVATLPPDVKANWETAYKQFLDSAAGSYVNDLFLTSTAIWISIAMAPVYCFLFVAIMSAFAEYIAWLCIVLIQVALVAGSVLCFLKKVKD